jgi:hypothetical protein
VELTRFGGDFSFWRGGFHAEASGLSSHYNSWACMHAFAPFFHCCHKCSSRRETNNLTHEIDARSRRHADRILDLEPMGVTGIAAAWGCTHPLIAYRLCHQALHNVGLTVSPFLSRPMREACG